MWQGFVKWFYQMASLPLFYTKIVPWMRGCGFAGASLLCVGLMWGLLFAPADYQQGDSFRIIYIHVPAASLAMSIYVLLALWGLIFLIWRIKLVDIFAQALAPLGATSCAIALITGALWGVPTWGAPFAADARILSMAFLLMLYIGLLLVRAQIKPLAKAQQLVSVIAIVGVLNVPIIKYSVEWFTTLHQGATFTLTEKPKMPPSMYLPLLCSVLGTYLCMFSWLFSQARRVCLMREADKRWVQAWLVQQLDSEHAATSQASQDPGVIQ